MSTSKMDAAFWTDHFTSVCSATERWENLRRLSNRKIAAKNESIRRAQYESPFIPSIQPGQRIQLSMRSTSSVLEVSEVLPVLQMLSDAAGNKFRFSKDLATLRLEMEAAMEVLAGDRRFERDKDTTEVVGLTSYALSARQPDRKARRFWLSTGSQPALSVSEVTSWLRAMLDYLGITTLRFPDNLSLEALRARLRLLRDQFKEDDVLDPEMAQALKEEAKQEEQRQQEQASAKMQLSLSRGGRETQDERERKQAAIDFWTK